jgi:hypothetical protein
MGADAYFYFTPYQKNIQVALERLREREFRAGRYEPAMSMSEPPLYMFQLRFPPDSTSPAPGAGHSTIEEAIEDAGPAGTQSILDIMRISNEPDFLVACPVPPDELIELLGTVKPTRKRIEAVLIRKHPSHDESIENAAKRFWDQIDRGEARYIVVYNKSEPCEIFFAGYSLD